MKSFRRTIGVLLALVILVALFSLPWQTMVLFPDWPAPVFWLGTAVFLLALVSFPILMVFGHGRRARDAAARIADFTLGLVWIAFVWTILGHLLRLVLALSGVDDPTRSRVVAVAVLVIFLVLAAWGHYEAMRVPRTRTVEVRLPRLGKGFDGARLVMITDTHLGPINRAKWSAKVVARINELDADIVCHAGDIADGVVARRREQAAPLADVRARLARIYITGNHEYFSDAEGWLDHMTELGWDSLHNRHLVVERGGDRLALAGIDDATAAAAKLAGHGADLVRALDGLADELPVILAAHQPKQIKVAEAAGVDLQLSGHTHGGQIWPFNLLVRLDQPVVHGLHKFGERTQLYVSRGSGFWGPPLRVFAPSEITVLVLRSA